MGRSSKEWIKFLPGLLFALLGLIGCTGTDSFGLTARAGDTVVLALGYQKNLKRQDVQVTITDSSAIQHIYAAGDSAIRAVFNSYPDPVSRLIVGAETGQRGLEGGYNGIATDLIDDSVTAGGKDYSQTFMILDLPATLSVGVATIEVADSGGNPLPNPSTLAENIAAINLEVVGGAGQSNAFGTQEGVSLVPGYFSSLERADHSMISFQSAGSVPYAIQLEMVHNPDMDNGGVGRAYVVPPRGDLLNLSWVDDGASTKVILMPTRGGVFSDINRFEFYVAGGVTGLAVQSVAGFDLNGEQVVGVTATIN